MPTAEILEIDIKVAVPPAVFLAFAVRLLMQEADELPLCNDKPLALIDVNDVSDA